MSQTTNSNYELLIQKLQEFISSYYIQLWIKGLLQLILILVSIYFISSTLEYNLYFSPAIRKFMFILFCLIGIGLLAYWVVFPMVKYYYFKSNLDNKKAAEIIGKHFPMVKDKLMNVLLLNEMSFNSNSSELIEASIDQKSKSLVLVRFNEAIDWARIYKLSKFLLIPIVLILVTLIFVPNLFKDSTYRILNYNQTFSPKAPFDFILNSKNLTVPQFESIVIKAKLSGKSLPSELNLLYKGVKYPMVLNEKNEYSFTISNIEKPELFRLESMGFYSDEYRIDIVPKPMISSFEVDIYPPTYTGIKSSNQKDIGDIQTVEGSTAIWKFKTSHVDDFKLKIGSQIYPAEKFINGYGLKLNLKKLTNYTLFFSNKESKMIDTQQFSVSLTPDAFPMISVQEFKDSLNEIIYYTGDVSDDYGISALYLVINFGGKLSKHAVKINKGKNLSFNLSTQDIFKKYSKGAVLNYCFEVFDNDQINGNKSSKSAAFQLKKLTENEIEKLVDNNTLQIQNSIKQSLKETKEFQKELEALKKKLFEKKELDLNDKKMLEDLLKKQEEIQKKLEANKDEIKRNFDKKNELTNQEKNILDQQKQLEEMMEQMKSPELEELMKKISELLEKSEKKELLQNIDKMDMKSEKMEKNLDRLMQLYKNLDYKQKLNDMIDKLDELSKDQKKLALESELNKTDIQKQKQVSKELDETRKKMDDLNKLNNEVNKTDKKEYEEIKEDMEDASQDQDNAEKELEQKDGNEAAEKQNAAAEKIDKAKKKLQNLKSKQKNNQKKEDARMMRRLLENIIYLSFEQEKILDRTKSISINSPSYTKLIQEEQRLKEDFVMVEDTLYKIASRQVKVRKFVFEEADKIISNTKQSIQHLVDRKPHQAVSNEQFAMSSYNKLGLMLSESLKNLEEDEDENDSDNPQMCNNPKMGKKKKSGMSLEKLAQMQDQLTQQMEKLQQQIKEKAEGKAKGEKNSENQKPSESGKDGKQGEKGKEAAEFAKIAAQQQAIRNAIKKIEESSNSPDKSGKKPLGNGLEDIMDKMNQTEKDLVNKRMYDEMIKRQKDIQIKLLESAKAQREQDEEEKRESERAKNIKPEPPLELKKYLENKKQNESLIQRTPIGLTPYFKTLSEKYFKLIK